MSRSQQSSSRPYEIVVFGGTGFTGERIALYLAKLQAAKKYTKKFAIAGRNESKLNAVKEKLQQQAGGGSSVNIDVIANVDTDQADSVKQMTSQAVCVISAVGPFRFYGPPVVQACVDTKTHYIDVTGEPEFIEKMIVLHDDAAQQKQLSIVHACGFDSIPSELGVQWTKEQFNQRYGSDAVMSHVDGYLTFVAKKGFTANTGTWYSLVHGLSSTHELAKWRKQLKKKYGEQNATIPRAGKPSKPKKLFYSKEMGKWCLLFPGADAAIVRNSAQQLVIHGDKSVQPHFSIYFTVPNFLYIIVFILFGAVLGIMTRTRFTKKLLLDYASVFSFGFFSTSGPSQEQLDNAHMELDLFAKGYQSKSQVDAEGSKPDKRLHTRLVLQEPGYVFTPIAAATAAITLVEDVKAGKRNTPNGDLTPAAAFAKTDLVKRLQEADVKFQVV